MSKEDKSVTEFEQQDSNIDSMIASTKPLEAPNIILSGHVGKTEEFKRPDHYDFMDSAELKAAKFSGHRHSAISNQVEVWIEGECLLSRDYEWIRGNTHQWAELYSEAMGLKEVKVVDVH